MELDTGIVEQLKSLLQPCKGDEIERLRKMLEFVSEIREQVRNEEDSDSTTERKRMELEHAERMRALELGQPLADAGEVARARSMVRAAATIGTLVPLALAGALISISILILLQWHDSRIQF